MIFYLKVWNGGAWEVEKKIKQRGAFSKYVTKRFPDITNDAKKEINKVINSTGGYQFGYIDKIYRIDVVCNY